MKITCEDDVKPLSCQRLRAELKLTQREFWEAVGVTHQQGHRHENGLTKEIPRTTRRLVFLHYVVGIPTGGSLVELKKLIGAYKSKPKEATNAG